MCKESGFAIGQKRMLRRLTEEGQVLWANVTFTECIQLNRLVKAGLAVWMPEPKKKRGRRSKYAPAADYVIKGRWVSRGAMNKEV